MIDRRTLLQGTFAAMVATPELLRAQPLGRPMRIAYLSSRSGPNEFEQAFERGLRERGLTASANVSVDYRFSGFDAERENANIAAMVASKPDVVVLGDALITRPARALSAMTPMVIVAFGDPVGSGATTNFARPDGNITGTAVFNVELSPKRLALLKQAIPDMQRGAALFNLRRRTKPLGVAATLEAGEAMGVKLTELGLALPEGVEEGLFQASRQGIQGVAIVSDLATITHRAAICDAALAHKLPTLFSNGTYLRSGGLMSYGPDLEGVFHRAAHFVRRSRWTP